MPKKQWDEPAEKIYANLPQSQKVDLKIKLHHHGLTQSAFLRGVVKAFLQEEEAFMNWFNAWKLTNSKIKSSKRHLKSDKLKESGERLSSKFGIKDGEIEDIFDVIAKEHPEL
jgi:hypothetical protein